MTINQFIKKYGVSIAVSRTSKNPHMPDFTGTHWTCLLRCENRTMQIYFSQGSAHKNAPTTADVLDCLASDASGYENARSFKEWANEYGYSDDSRKAERTYKVVKTNSIKLKSLLGGSAYETLLWKVERL